MSNYIALAVGDLRPGDIVMNRWDGHDKAHGTVVRVVPDGWWRTVHYADGTTEEVPYFAPRTIFRVREGA